MMFSRRKFLKIDSISLSVSDAVFHIVLFCHLLCHVYVHLSSAAASKTASTGTFTNATINHCILCSCSKCNSNKYKYKIKQQNRKKVNRVYNMNYITTSLSGSTWNHCLFHCLPSPEIFNSDFHGTDASYIQTLSPKCSFSSSRTHGRHPSHFFPNFDRTQPLKVAVVSLNRMWHSTGSQWSCLRSAVAESP